MAEFHEQFFVVQLDRHSGLVTTVYNTWHATGATQAAARTRTFYVTFDGFNFDTHVEAPKNAINGGTALKTASRDQLAAQKITNPLIHK
jgi:hypothetical protein